MFPWLRKRKEEEKPPEEAPVEEPAEKEAAPEEEPASAEVASVEEAAPEQAAEKAPARSAFRDWFRWRQETPTEEPVEEEAPEEAAPEEEPVPLEATAGEEVAAEEVVEEVAPEEEPVPLEVTAGEEVATEEVLEEAAPARPGFRDWFRPREEKEVPVEVPTEEEAPPPANLEEGLARTRQGFFARIGQLLRGGKLDQDAWDEMEALLIQADVGVETTTEMIERLRERVRAEGIRDPVALRQALAAEMKDILESVQHLAKVPAFHEPLVILTVGVNGVGKTTTIAKLANMYRRQGKQVLLAAADTFRAAAIEQLQIWGERAHVPVIAHQPGADPGAVAFDAISAAESRNAHVVIIDTAGRLHTKHNLMQELEKVYRVIQRKMPSAPHQVLLVIDATTGQNGLAQARVFTSSVQVTDLALAKLDGTAKGGIAFAIAHELGLPISYVGTGERLEDLAPFDADRFVKALLGS